MKKVFLDTNVLIDYRPFSSLPLMTPSELVSSYIE